MDKKSMLVAVEAKELVAVEGGASLDVRAFLSDVRARVTETRTNTATVAGNLLFGHDNTIAIQQS
jgi:hypothetical protein